MMRDSIESFAEIQKDHTYWVSLVNWVGNFVIMEIKFAKQDFLLAVGFYQRLHCLSCVFQWLTE